MTRSPYAIRANYSGTPLCFDRDCPHCGLAYIYPPVEFADGDTACIWCADHERRPDCWRRIMKGRLLPLTADMWRLNIICKVDKYPVLPLEVRK